MGAITDFATGQDDGATASLCPTCGGPMTAAQSARENGFPLAGQGPSGYAAAPVAATPGTGGSPSALSGAADIAKSLFADLIPASQAASPAPVSRLSTVNAARIPQPADAMKVRNATGDSGVRG